jgi:hypothetical protein
MDHIRIHKLSPGVPNSRISVSNAHKRQHRSESASTRYGNYVQNDTGDTCDKPDFLGYARSLSASIDRMISVGGGAASLSVEALLQEVSVTRLIGICRSIPGAKILTVCRDHDAAFTARVSKDDKIADGRVTTRMLRSELNQALTHGGTFIIRQLLPMKTPLLVSGGKAVWITWKNVYAFYLGNGSFESIPVDHLNYANSVGPDGKPVAKEHGVRFCEYRAPAHMLLT